MNRSRRNHTPAFKAKAASAAVKDDQATAGLAKRFDVSPSLIAQWKSQLLKRPSGVFGGYAGARENDANVTELRAKIGQLASEKDFSERALGRLDGPSAER